MVPSETVALALQASYLDASEADDLLLSAPPDGWFLVEELSSEDTRVYRDGSDSGSIRAIITFRGSSTVQDWLIDDVAIATGLHFMSGRLQSARRICELAREEFGSPLALVGHSLGGWLAENAAQRGDIVVTADKAVGLGDLWKQRLRRQTDYRARGDIVSFLGATQSGGQLVEFVPGESRTFRMNACRPPSPQSVLESAMNLAEAVVDRGGAIGSVLRGVIDDAVAAHSVDEASRFIAGGN